MQFYPNYQYTMGRLTFFTVLTLLYLQWGDATTPIPSGKEYVYSYAGLVQALNLEYDYIASQWNISAKLIMQANGDKIVMKFDDIKTSLGNGNMDDTESTRMLSLPGKAHQLYLPFVVHYHKNGSVSSLSCHSDEDLWSLNMKRAIASIIQIDTENVEHLHRQQFYEQNIYGNCEVEYSVDKQESGSTISKKVDEHLCNNPFKRRWSTTITPESFQPATTTAERTYKFVQNEGTFLLKHIESMSNITSRTMPSERSSLLIVQSQVFELLSDSAISKPIDVTKVTDSTALIYFLDDNDTTSGRHVKQEVNPEKLLADLQHYYEEFKTDFHKFPLVPGDLGFNNSLINIFEALSQMDKDTLDITAFGVMVFADEEVQSIFISQLPYIGTNETIQLIENVLKADSLNDLLAIKLMAIFPNYVNDYNEDLLKKMEVLLNLKEAENQQVKNAGIMCFANLLAKATIRGQIFGTTVEKYYTVFNNHFKNADNYEDKMVYLLGLINMGPVLHVDHMLPIIKDKEQSHHIRTLAAYGFKPVLVLHKKIFEQLWPIVKDHEEHFEMRVAALDLLMSSALTQQEFDIIIAEFNKETDDQVEQHLQNYLVTTLQSLQNTTMYSDSLGRMATESAELVTIPSHYDTWTTGNYRLAYTDDKSNFGSYIQARLVSNPITNMVNLVQLSSNQFAMSLNLGNYTAYIRLDGVADTIFSGIFFDDYDSGIPQLVELLKKFNYKLIEDLDVHIEVVLFCDNSVVFGMYMNKDNIDKYTDNPLMEDLYKLLVNYEYISLPKTFSRNLRTDLGTHAEVYIIEADVVSHKLETDMEKLFDDSEIKHAELNYRSSKYESVVLESYNPLMDVTINVYKYKSSALRVHLPIGVNVTGEYFTFDNINDSINVMVDRTLGVYVDDSEKLALFGDCPAVVEVPNHSYHEKMLQLEDFGIIFNVTSTGTPAHEIPSFSQLIGSYQSNSLAIPLAEPVLFVWYLLDYNRYLGSEIGSVSIRSKAFYEEPTENVWQWDFDIVEAYDANDFINGSELSVYSRISCRRKHDGKLLSSIGANYAYTDAPMTHEKTGFKHVEQKHKFRADYQDDDTHYMACFDREIQYPSRRSDKWSISPVEPAKGKGRFSVGTSDENNACSNDFSITFTDIFESSEKLMENVKNMKEYTTCKKDSAGFKYTPPTDACYAIHDAVSKYTNYTLYVDFKNAGRWSKYDKLFRTSDRGMKFLQMYYVQDDVARFIMSRDFLDYLDINSSVVDAVLDRDIYLGAFSGIEDPTAIAYDDYDSNIGLSSSCDITPSEISTFTGKEIKDYESKDGKEIVAYIECFDKTHGGMTIQKFSDKKVGFTMWSGNETLITSVAGDKLKVVLNGEELHKPHISDGHFKVYFLEDDVLYITDELVQVYYNTEYISVKTPSIYNNYVCGLCAHVNKFNTDNQIK